MNWKVASSWVGAIVVLSGAFGGVLLVAGGAAALPTGCSAVVAGENQANNALQTAINNAAWGATICVRTGTFPEQLKISTPDLHIVGAGVGRTIIDPTTAAVNTVDWDSASVGHAPVSSLAPVIAVVLIDNVSGVLLKGLTVNAAGAAATIAGCSPGLVGVDFQNVSSGAITNAVVTNVELSPSLLGCQFQIGLYAYTGYYDTGYIPTFSTVTISHTTVSAYGKGGVVCDDPGLACVMTHDKVLGIGPTPATAMNGIQVAYGATASILSTKVTGNDYTGVTASNDFYGSGYAASGILLYLAAAGTTIEQSTISGNQIGILGYDDASDTFQSNHIKNSYAYGIAEYGSPSSIAYITGNTITNPTTKSVGILVANGTFYLTNNKVAWSLTTGDQGASQAVTGPGTVYPTSPAQSIATAAVQAISDGDPTTVYQIGTVVTHSSAAIATLAVFGGSVDILA